MLSEVEERIFRDLANLAAIRGCHTLAALALTELDRLGGKGTLNRAEHAQARRERLAAIKAVTTRSRLHGP